MLDVQRADSLPARDAAQPNVGLGKPYTCRCNMTPRDHGARGARADRPPARSAAQPGVGLIKPYTCPCNMALRHAIAARAELKPTDRPPAALRSRVWG